jgi:catecholate siderophore receptor
MNSDSRGDEMRRGKVSKKNKNTRLKSAAPEKQPSASPTSLVRSSIRKPGPAMLSLASVMLATSAMAQDGGALPTIDVQDTAGGGYQTTDSQLTRIPTPLRDTPQTINVVPQQVIQEQRITSMEDALRTVPGITFNAGEGGQQGDSPNIRGFAARGDIFRDGVRDPGWYTRDLFSSDRVEVYKGPSAFAFGRGSTGGAINIVSKLPVSAVPYLEGTITGTSAGGYRAEVDASGKKDNVWGRISALYQDVPTPDRDNVYTKRWGVAPSLKIDLNEDTRVSLNYIYQGEESIPDYGHPYLPGPSYDKGTGALTSGGYYGNGRATPPIPVPRSNWFGVKNGPLADIVKTEAHTITGKFEHDFTNDLKFSNTTRYVSVDRFTRTTAPRALKQADNVTNVTPGYPVQQMTIGREHFQVETDNSLLVNQTDLAGKFSTGEWLHTFSVGAEFAQETRNQQRAAGMVARNLCDPANPLCRTNAYYPVDTSFGGVFAGWNPPNATTSTTAAIYASDQIKINEYFELLGSIRFDNFDTKYTDYALPVATREQGRVDNMTSWRVGGVFHPTKNSSIYAAYGVSFNPSAEFGSLTDSATSTSSPLLAPERNTTVEVGAKADFLNNRLSVTGAVFRIEKTNLRVPDDPVTQTAVVLDGLARVQGVELGVTGSITDKWSVFAGYSYLDSKIVKTTNLAELGRELPSTPRNNFTLWSTYAFDSQWTVGGGAIYQSDAFVNTTNTSYVPAYWRFDAMLAYKVTPNSTLQLNVYNIGDELYYAQYYGGHAVPASGRYASLSYRIRFEPPPAVKYDK